MRKGETGSKCSPEMPTNLSRYTVAFSDLAWTSVDFEQKQGIRNGAGKASIPPMFPKAWQVGRYLEAYAQKYIPPGTIIFNCLGVQAIRLNHEGTPKWQVKWRRRCSPESSHPKDGEHTKLECEHHKDIYDFLIAAPGFFTTSKDISLKFSRLLEDEVLPFQCLHSTKFRSVEDLVNHTSDDSGGNIVVVGGGMSGSEAAAIAAMQISDSLHSPVSRRKFENMKIIHIITRPFYALPRYHPLSFDSKGHKQMLSSFAPVDLCSNELRRRQDDPISAWNGRVTPERASKTHAYLNTVLGGDQGELGYPSLVCRESETGDAPYIGLTDTYAEFVRSGIIVPTTGRAVGLGTKEDAQSASTSASKANGFVAYSPHRDKEEQELVTDVRGVILAQGFTSHPGIRWLPRDVLEELEFDDKSHRLPIMLQRYQVCNDRVPSLGFVGFYEGAYWGILEMQARLLTRKWLSMIDNDVDFSMLSLNEEAEKDLDFVRDLRQGIAEGSRSVPQFWMGDYTGVMESMARELHIPRNDSILGERSGPVCAARYTTPADDQAAADETLRDLADVLARASTSSLFVPLVTFRALQGHWTLTRTLDNALDAAYSGSLDGRADFHPRRPTDPAFDAEYLYVEQGTLRMNGHAVPTTRRYVYRYREDEDRASVWFVKSDGKTVDYFFHDIEFGGGGSGDGEDDGDGEGEGGEGKACSLRRANGYHLCEKDHYTPSYAFEYAGANIRRFEVTFDVKGPKKDYSSRSEYIR